MRDECVDKLLDLHRILDACLGPWVAYHACTLPRQPIVIPVVLRAQGKGRLTKISGIRVDIALSMVRIATGVRGSITSAVVQELSQSLFSYTPRNNRHKAGLLCVSRSYSIVRSGVDSVRGGAAKVCKFAPGAATRQIELDYCRRRYRLY